VVADEKLGSLFGTEKLRQPHAYLFSRNTIRFFIISKCKIGLSSYLEQRTIYHWWMGVFFLVVMD